MTIELTKRESAVARAVAIALLNAVYEAEGASSEGPIYEAARKAAVRVAPDVERDFEFQVGLMKQWGVGGHLAG